jgi:drug/metabolite transporter (DMT)-like permease
VNPAPHPLARLSDQGRGILLAVTGVFLLSPDSLLIRWIHLDLWTLMFLRGLFMGLTLLALNLLLRIGRNQSAGLFQLDRHAWTFTLLMTVSSLFFVAAVQTTSIAHTLIIVGATPVVSALLGWVILRERVGATTLWTIGIVMIGLGFVVYDDSRSSLLGDLYAAIACLLWSGNFILMRLTRTPSHLSMMTVSGFVLAVATLPLAQLGGVEPWQWGLGVASGFVVGFSFWLITLAPKYIPAAEVALFMPLESVFGSLLAWWLLDEFPGWISVIAGSIIILAIMLNSYVQIRKTSV